MPRLSLNSGAYSAASLIANAQRSVNLFPESNPRETTPPVPVTHYPRPGLTLLSKPPVQGKGRMLYRATNGNLYAVIDQAVYYIDQNWVWTNIGAILTPGTTPVIASDNGTNAVLVDNSANGYSITLASNAFGNIGDPNFLGATRVDFIDSFLLFNQIGTRNFYSSLANQVSFDALLVGTKTAWPDAIQTLITVERAVWLLGSQKSELWFNAGSVPFSFQIQPGLIVEHGCVAPYSAAKQDVNCYWLSESPEGARMAMKGTQNIALRISNHAVETEWLTYPRVDDAIGSTYQMNGHAFYCLDFPTADKTWVFDQATEQWHEWDFIDSNGVSHRSLVPYKAYAYGTNVGLNFETGALFQLDPNSFADNSQPIRYLRSFPHLEDDNSTRLTVWKFIADCQVGTPSPDAPAPLISLRISHDRGASYGNAVTQPMGAAGLYLTRPTWYRCGFGTDFVFELSWSAAMKTALNGAFIEVEEHEADR